MSGTGGWRSGNFAARAAAGLVCLLASVSTGCAVGASGSATASTGGAVRPPVAPPPVTAASGDLLAQLVIDDAPHRDGYRREEWPHWLDLDGDGCDARDAALAAASAAPVTRTGCDVVAGAWTSDYDGQQTTDPRALDVDHVVPLENAHESGGWTWSTDRRAAFANDPEELWVVSASSNRSKGARSPDEWRPAATAVWCRYAERWLAVKVRWQLSATTEERDALGRMLETCADGNAAPATPTTTGDVWFANCKAARAAGAAPLHRGEPGYREQLDGDHDGVACE